MIYGSSFTYDGVSSDSYNVILCTIDNFGLDEADMGLGTEIIWDSSSLAERYEYASKYSSVLSFEMTLCNKDFTSFTRTQVRSLAKWLTGRTKSAWLSIKDEAYDDLHYNCRVVSMAKKKAGSRVLGLVLKWECSSPFAYTEEYTCRYTITGPGQQVILYNDSDDTEHYLYPCLTIEARDNMDFFSIVNESDQNRETKLNQIAYNEIIRMDNQNGILSTNIHDKALLPLFEGRKWFQLLAGENRLRITGNCNLSISYRFPRKAGDF